MEDVTWVMGSADEKVTDTRTEFCNGISDHGITKTPTTRVYRGDQTRLSLFSSSFSTAYTVLVQSLQPAFRAKHSHNTQ